jgi:hypothetical protein
MKFSVAIITFSLILPSFLCAQQIYKWKDENGQWHISNAPGEVQGEVTTAESWPGSIAGTLSNCELRQ